MNKNYNLSQGVNFIEIPLLNVKKLSHIQDFVKNGDNDNYSIKSLFDNVTKTPNIINVKNPSNDCILYFGNRDDTSRINYLFRVFPGQEVNYFLHEMKMLYCYVTQLNNSINIDINFNYISEKNYLLNSGIDINQLKYENLKLLASGTIGAGVTSLTEIFYGMEWVKNITLKIATNQTWDLYLYRLDVLGNSDLSSTIVSGGSSTSGAFTSYTLIPSNTASENGLGAHGIKFGLKNTSGSNMTGALYGEFFG
jgi:hypothetical protein